MNITVNDLDMNKTLDQAAMTDLLGGISTSVGPWVLKGASYGSINATSGFHFDTPWRYTGRLFQKKRYGHQHGKQIVVRYFRRSITQSTNLLGF